MLNKITKTSNQIVLFFECSFIKVLKMLQLNLALSKEGLKPNKRELLIVYPIERIVIQNSELYLFLFNILQRTPYRIISDLISRLGFSEQSTFLVNCCFGFGTRLS